MKNQFVKILLLGGIVLSMAACGGEKGGTDTKVSADIELRTDKTQSGQKQEEYEFDKKTQLRHGKSVFYYEDGKVLIEQTFDQGKIVGKQVLYYPNGKVKSETLYAAGKREGGFKDYFEDGTLMQEGTNKNNVLEGPLKTYYANGKLKETVMMAGGLESGAFEEYDEAGRLTTRGTYTTNGEGEAKENGLLEEFDSTGQVVAKRECEMGTCYQIWDIKKGDMKPKKIMQ